MATEPILRPDRDTLTPLPPSHLRGLTAVAVIASVSFISTTTLFFHLTYKLIRWRLRINRRRRNDEPAGNADLSLGLDQRHFTSGTVESQEPKERKRPHPNQFVVLIYNLLLADMHQAMAFLLNAVWVGRNGVFVDAGPCWAQGWFVSTGDLSSSCFISAIAVHTYMTVVRGYKPPDRALNTAIVCVWVFVYLISVSGIAATSNGRAEGGFFVRAAAWCWMNESYETLRLVTHYLFIFMSLALTSILYGMIFFTLRSRSRNPSSTTSSSSSSNRMNGKTSLSPSKMATNAAGHHPAFLVYPVIYVLCTSPLAIGRIATMAGARVPIEYFCAAGALIVSNGWLDVLLWGTTRRILLFGAVENDDALGLDTFTFIRTPANRKYGNMIWVQGASDGEVLDGGAGDRRTPFWKKLGFGSRRRDRPSWHGGSRKPGERSISQESLRGPRDLGMAIHMDRITTVVVEIDDDKKDARGRQSSGSTRGSDDVVRHGL